jgi:hypothetical protein
MIKVSTDNIKTYQLLENSNNLFDNYDNDKVLLFDLEGDCVVILFSSSSKNFVSFIAQNYRDKSNSLPDLLESVNNYSNPDLSDSLIVEAVN